MGLRELPLTKGHSTKVTDEWYPILSAHKWSAAFKHSKGTVYAKREENGKTILMHRVIAGAKPGELVDHRDGIGTNNWPGNLRICTNTQNQRAFCRKRPCASSQYRGVDWMKQKKKWRASIRLHPGKGGLKYLGLFTAEEGAARAYDTAALKEFGREFVHLNFPA